MITKSIRFIAAIPFAFVGLSFTLIGAVAHSGAMLMAKVVRAISGLKE